MAKRSSPYAAPPSHLVALITATLMLRDLRTEKETTLLSGFGRVNFPS
jgi:hypothetical protein